MTDMATPAAAGIQVAAASRWRRRENRRRTMVVIQTVAVALIALVIVSPLIALAVASLKTDRFQILADMGSFRAFWVEDPSLETYRELLTFSGAFPYGRYLVNSVTILAVTVAGGLVINSMAAFALACGRSRIRGFVLGALIALYIIPLESIVLPLLLVVNRAGLMDTFSAQILPFVGSPLYIFLFYQFFRQVPKELTEAATVDGCSFFRIYRSVYVPLSLPVMATVAILLGIEMWNQYLWPLMVTQTDYARPLPVAIASFLGQDSVFWDRAMTASVLMMLPVLIFYLAFQRWFVSSFMGSAVKG